MRILKSNFLPALCALLFLAAGARAQGPWVSGSCAVVLNTPTLTVGGNGPMADYAGASTVPWYVYNGQFTSVVVQEGVTHIGNNAFFGCVHVTDVYCYADPANLTWIPTGSDFNGSATVCHVKAEYASAYETKFAGANITFVGDLNMLDGYSVSLKAGTEDAEHWQAEVNDGAAQPLPVSGLQKGDAVKLQYTGLKRVKKVTAKPKL